MRKELALVCFPEREDPRDVLVSRDGSKLDDLPKHAHIGTTSLRRSTQLLTRRADLRISTLRGNVDTRIRKLNDGEFDAVVLALAGLKRLKLTEQVKYEVLPFEVCVPAVGQGTLALQARRDDKATHALLAPLHHRATELFVAAERALLLELRGNCFSPIGGIAYLSEDRQRLCMQALVASHDGRRLLQARTDIVVRGNLDQLDVAQAEQLGRDTAQNLLQRGARELIDQAEIMAIQRQSHSN
jgi:hydroxymethylbilane synthase